MLTGKKHLFLHNYFFVETESVLQKCIYILNSKVLTLQWLKLSKFKMETNSSRIYSVNEQNIRPY